MIFLNFHSVSLCLIVSLEQYSINQDCLVFFQKHELTHNDTTEVASPPLTKKSTEKVYELYHLDEET